MVLRRVLHFFRHTQQTIYFVGKWYMCLLRDSPAQKTLSTGMVLFLLLLFSPCTQQTIYVFNIWHFWVLRDAATFLTHALAVYMRTKGRFLYKTRAAW